MTDFYLTGHDADDVNSYLIADGDGWVTPPALPGATDRVIIAGMRSGDLNVAAVLGYSGNFNPSPVLDSPASISGGSVTANSAPLGLLIGNSSGHTHADVTINGDITGDVDVTDGDVTANSIDGGVSVHADGTVAAEAIVGSVLASSGGRVDVSGDIDASDGTVSASKGTVKAGGKIATQGFTTGDGGLIRAASIVGDGTASMMNYMDGGRVIVGDYNVSGDAALSSRLDILEGARMTATGGFGSGRLAGNRDSVYVNGAGSQLQLSGDLTAGDRGQGSLNVSNGGMVAGPNDLTLGEQKSGDGTISVDGQKSELNLDGNLIAGDLGKGRLTISNGGLVGGLHDIKLGEQQSGNGTITVGGKDSEFNVSGNLVAGDRGKGFLTVDNAADVSLTDVTLGKQQSGKGKITVNGEHSQLSLSGELIVGDRGIGGLVVQHLAEVKLEDVTLGNRNSAKGVISVEGGQLDARSLEIGAAGIGVMLLDGVGSAVVKNLVLGVSAGSDGSIGIDDDSLLIVKKSATIGEKGVGALVVENGDFESDNGLTIGSNGQLSVNGQDGATHGRVTISRLTTIDKHGFLVVDGSVANVTLDSAEISGQMWVSGGDIADGRIHVKNRIDGDGKIAIGKSGNLILDGDDHNVDISFVASGKQGGTLTLAHADLLHHAVIKGFARGDLIAFKDLAGEHATFGAARKGANTVVTFHDQDGDTLGAVTLAGHYSKSSLHLGADGILTTGKSAAVTHAAATAAADDDFHLATQAVTRSPDSETRGEHGAGELEVTDTHVVHDHGWW